MIPTNATSTYFPVGLTPGSIQSISVSCVKHSTPSFTTRSTPTVRDIGILRESLGFLGMKWCL